ncbi:hypothetical protein HDU76_013961 [Blyttiomyces sp. JEL0837]|nr:hypothetical protein HDU76_013961 [Blyttiomyces sp. JEL0837]
MFVAKTLVAFLAAASSFVSAAPSSDRVQKRQTFPLPKAGDYDNCNQGAQGNTADFAVEMLPMTTGPFTIEIVTTNGTPVNVKGVTPQQGTFTGATISGNLISGMKAGQVQLRGTISFDAKANGINDCNGRASQLLAVNLIALGTGTAAQGNQPAQANNPPPQVTQPPANNGNNNNVVTITSTITSTIFVTVTAGGAVATPPPAPTQQPTMQPAVQMPAANAPTFTVAADFDNCYGNMPTFHQFAIEGLAIPEPGDNFVVMAAFVDTNGNPVNFSVGALYVGKGATVMNGNILVATQAPENNQIRGAILTMGGAATCAGGKNNIVINPLSYSQNGVAATIVKKNA